MTDFTIQTYAAVEKALEMSQLGEKEIQNAETGIVLGCDSSCIAAVEQVELLRKSWPKQNPLEVVWFFVR